MTRALYVCFLRTQMTSTSWEKSFNTAAANHGPCHKSTFKDLGSSNIGCSTGISSSHSTPFLVVIQTIPLIAYDGRPSMKAAIKQDQRRRWPFLRDPRGVVCRTWFRIDGKIDPQYLADIEWRFVCFDIKSTSWKRLQRQVVSRIKSFRRANLFRRKKSTPFQVSTQRMSFCGNFLLKSFNSTGDENSGKQRNTWPWKLNHTSALFT